MPTEVSEKYTACITKAQRTGNPFSDVKRLGNEDGHFPPPNVELRFQSILWFRHGLIQWNHETNCYFANVTFRTLLGVAALFINAVKESAGTQTNMT